MGPPTPGSEVPTMDLSSLRYLDDVCPIK
jgi:hypothetical protein